MVDRMRVYIDTEFTDFGNRDIISLGLVAENGNQFYGENVQYEKKWASQFVKDNVLPLCNFQKYGMSRERLAGKSWEWFEELPSKEITLMIDYGGDNELLYELFSNTMHPKVTLVQNIFTPLADQAKNHMLAGATIEQSGAMFTKGRNVYKIEFHNYFKETGEIKHHALSDAKANMRGFNAMMKAING